MGKGSDSRRFAEPARRAPASPTAWPVGARAPGTPAHPRRVRGAAGDAKALAAPRLPRLLRNHQRPGSSAPERPARSGPPRGLHETFPRGRGIGITGGAGFPRGQGSGGPRGLPPPPPETAGRAWAGKHSRGRGRHGDVRGASSSRSRLSAIFGRSGGRRRTGRSSDMSGSHTRP